MLLIGRKTNTIKVNNYWFPNDGINLIYGRTIFKSTGNADYSTVFQ